MVGKYGDCQCAINADGNKGKYQTVKKTIKTSHHPLTQPVAWVGYQSASNGMLKCKYGDVTFQQMQVAGKCKYGRKLLIILSDRRKALITLGESNQILNL